MIRIKGVWRPSPKNRVCPVPGKTYCFSFYHIKFIYIHRFPVSSIFYELRCGTIKRLRDPDDMGIIPTAVNHDDARAKKSIHLLRLSALSLIGVASATISHKSVSKSHAFMSKIKSMAVTSIALTDLKLIVLA
jgi:hypothetical protein